MENFCQDHLASMLGNAMAGRAMPGRAMPGRAMPGRATPGRAMPVRATAGHAMAFKLPSSKTLSSQVTSSITSVTQKSFLIAALVEGRGLAKGEIGLAAMDVRHPELLLSQFSDTAAYAKLRVKLQVLSPSAIVVPDTAVEQGGNMVALMQSLKHDFPRLPFTPMKRKFFNETQGIEILRRLMTGDFTTLERELREKYYTLACGAALIRHIESIQNIAFAPKSVKVSYKSTEHTCMIDLDTAKHLELIVCLKDMTDTDRSLYGNFSRASTAGGARTLRAAILQPSSNVAVIEARLDAVTELKQDAGQFQALRGLISRMLDVDHLVSLCSHLNREETVRSAEYKLTQTIYLKHTLELVEALREAVGRYSSPLFKWFQELLSDGRFEEILEKINRSLQESTRYEKNALNMLSQKCFAVKPNVNAYLDVLRRTYSELLQDMEEMCSDLSDQFRLPIVVGYSTPRGFYMQMKLMRDAQLPHQLDSLAFINLVRKGNTVTFTTMELVKTNDRIAEVVHQIFSISGSVVTELLSKIRESIMCLFNLTEVVATVDFLSSLTLFCTKHPDAEFTRPIFCETLAVSNGRHPLLERSCDQPNYFPNDVYSEKGANIAIITGPNMSGKSTYLKMVAVLQVLAQVGSYVPAADASFRVTTQIFTRMGQNDDLERKSSAFVLEMKDANYILQNITDRSLILIDELGRGTSPEEGLSICYAVCEALINTEASVFIATHFLELSSLDYLYPNVENYHFEGQTSGEEQESTVVVNHTLRKHRYRGPTYGFELAEISGLPQKLITRAKTISKEIRLRSRTYEEEDLASRREHAAIRMGHHLLHAAHSAMDTDSLLENLRQLRINLGEDLGLGPVPRQESLLGSQCDGAFKLPSYIVKRIRSSTTSFTSFIEQWE